jgi:hypothetical protein
MQYTFKIGDRVIINKDCPSYDDGITGTLFHICPEKDAGLMHRDDGDGWDDNEDGIGEVTNAWYVNLCSLSPLNTPKGNRRYVKQ